MPGYNVCDLQCEEIANGAGHSGPGQRHLLPNPWESSKLLPKEPGARKVQIAGGFCLPCHGLKQCLRLREYKHSKAGGGEVVA